MTVLLLFAALLHGASEPPPFYDNKTDLLYYLSEENEQIPINSADNSAIPQWGRFAFVKCFIC